MGEVVSAFQVPEGFSSNEHTRLHAVANWYFSSQQLHSTSYLVHDEGRTPLWPFSSSLYTTNPVESMHQFSPMPTSFLHCHYLPLPCFARRETCADVTSAHNLFNQAGANYRYYDQGEKALVACLHKCVHFRALHRHRKMYRSGIQRCDCFTVVAFCSVTKWSPMYGKQVSPQRQSMLCSSGLQPCL